jgi:hypothetical protein
MKTSLPPLPGPCGPCRAWRHRDCTGRARGCTCWSCPGRFSQIITEATAMARSSYTEAHQARAMVAELVSLLTQNRARMEAAAAKARRGAPAYCSECHTEIFRSPMGGLRQTCSGRCRTARYRRLHSQKRASAFSGPAAIPASAPAARVATAASRPKPVPMPVPMPDFATPAGSVLEKFLRTGSSW